MALGLFPTQKEGMRFAEAIVSEWPNLLNERSVSGLKPYGRDIMDLRRSPERWMSLADAVSPEGDFSLDEENIRSIKKPRKPRSGKAKLSPSAAKILRRAERVAIVPGGTGAPERTTYKLISSGLLERSPNNASLFQLSEKGRQALQDGFFIREP
jgi:hypothetical protein